MKKKLLIIPIFIIFIVLLGAFSSEYQNKKSNKKMKLENKIDSASYAIGVNIGQNLKAQGLTELNVNAISAALGDVFAKNDLQISEQDAGKIVQEFVEETTKKRIEANKSNGAKFLEENAKKSGVITLPSGLQYEIITEGSGAKPTASNKVKTHYHGTLIDGTVFDSSVKRGEPLTFPVGGVIKGWQEALQLMSVGSKWKLYVPYNLAYGERGAGGAIAPFSTLIFEVELLEIIEE
jgi:FKBP-type peptidyl-prolyl cis-trans isomerase FklB